MRGLTKIGKTFIEIPNGQIEYIISGTYLFTVPENVTSVSVVAVGGGNGASTTYTGYEFEKDADCGEYSG